MNPLSRRHMMAALAHAGGHALQGDLGRIEAQIDNLDSIAALFPPVDALDVGPSTQSAFEGKIHRGRGETIKF